MKNIHEFKINPDNWILFFMSPSRGQLKESHNSQAAGGFHNQVTGSPKDPLGYKWTH